MRFFSTVFALLLLALTSTAQEASYTPISKSFFYLKGTKTPIFTSLQDTASPSPRLIAKREQVLVLGYQDMRWAVIEYKGTPYYTQVNNLDRLGSIIATKPKAEPVKTFQAVTAETKSLSTPTFYTVEADNVAAFRAAGDTSTVAAIIPRGQKVLIMAHYGSDWYSIAREGQRYYVRKRYISYSPAPTPTSSSSSSSYYPSSSSSGSSHTIHTGPRGGRYYINGNGNKTYIKRK